MQISHPPEYGEKRTLNALDYEVYHMNDSDSSKVRLHSHDFFEVFFLLSGVMDYIVEGSRYTLEPGSLLLIPPNELHRPEISTVSTFDRIVLWISPSYLSLLSQDIPGLFTELLSCSQLSHHLSPQVIPSPVIENTLRTLLHEHHNQEEGHILMRRLIISQFLILVKRTLSSLRRENAASVFDTSSPAAAQYRPDTGLTEVFRYISAHLTEDISVSDLAERFFFNENTLARRFKKHADVTIPEYIRQKRLAMARLCMYQGMNATDAGIASGFSDYTTFYRAFRKAYGISPKAFAETIHKTPAPSTS